MAKSNLLKISVGLGLLIIAAYILGAWVLVLGFALGYFRVRLLLTVLLGAIAAAVLSLFLAVASCSTGFLGLLGCPFAIFGSIIWILPALIIGAIQAAIGFYVAKWVKGDLGRRR